MRHVRVQARAYARSPGRLIGKWQNQRTRRWPMGGRQGFSGRRVSLGIGLLPTKLLVGLDENLISDRQILLNQRLIVRKPIGSHIFQRLQPGRFLAMLVEDLTAAFSGPALFRPPPTDAG